MPRRPPTTRRNTSATAWADANHLLAGSRSGIRQHLVRPAGSRGVDHPQTTAGTSRITCCGAFEDHAIADITQDEPSGDLVVDHDSEVRLAMARQ
jgi:hypothetical protein